MGLLQKCIETYDAMNGIVGVKVEGRQTLAPIGHIIAKASLEITIDNNGDFISAKKIDEKVVIPCTDDSSARTSKPVAHPLCDQICYVSGNDSEKYELYIEGLKRWVESSYKSDKLDSVLAYVKKQSLLNDIKRVGIDGIDDKDMVTWRVIGFEELNGSVCEDVDLQSKYTEYYLSILKKDNNLKEDYCMVAGEKTVTTSKHLKGVVAINGNAKIISSNDKNNYTFRGRFQNADEACSVGYESSQKAHNALQWVVANEGVFLGNRICVCWNPSGNELPKIDLPILINSEKIVSPTRYQYVLKEKILGYRRKLPETEGVIIAMFDAATTGRLSVTYYNELLGSDFINRLATWDEKTSFPNSFYGIQSPRLSDFVNFSYGTYRGEYFETDDKLFKQQMQKMIICRVDNGRMPVDIVKKLIKNCSRLYLYNNTTRDKLLHVTCAALKKRFYDLNFNKEECNMALEKDKTDRSYQYGRLLAVLEKMEKDTYDDSESKRETNAIRSQNMFVQQPQKWFASVMGKLQQSYIRKLPENTKIYYDKLIQEIVSAISECGEELRAPLSETYIMGYYLQKQALYTKKNIELNENEEQ